MENYKTVIELFNTFNNEKDTIIFCQNNNLIPLGKKCSKKSKMKMQREGNYYFWRCKHKKESVRKNTMFKNIRIKIGAFLRILL